MDIDLLIVEMEKRSCLWDKSDYNYKKNGSIKFLKFVIFLPKFIIRVHTVSSFASGLTNFLLREQPQQPTSWKETSFCTKKIWVKCVSNLRCSLYLCHHHTCLARSAIAWHSLRTRYVSQHLTLRMFFILSIHLSIRWILKKHKI